MCFKYILVMSLFFHSCCLMTSLKEVMKAETQVNTSRWRRLFCPHSVLALCHFLLPKQNGWCLLMTWLPVSLWLARERGGALHGHAPTDARSQHPGGRRSRHALPVGIGGGAFFHHWPAWRGPDHRPADRLPTWFWPLTFSRRCGQCD